MTDTQATTVEKPAEPVPVIVLDDLVDKRKFLGRTPRPLLGGTLWTFGALLWAYLVMGELVVHGIVAEALAFTIVALALGLAWYGAARHAEGGKLARKVAPGIAGIVLFFVTLFLAASMFGSSRSKTIEAVTVAFWFPALFAYVFGRGLIRAPKPVLSRRARAGGIALWVVSSLGTAFALLGAMSRM